MKGFIQDNEEIVYVACQSNVGQGKKKALHLVSEAPLLLWTHSADTELNGRHATNMTKY